MLENPAQFIKAGKAIFTIENTDTGDLPFRFSQNIGKNG